MTVSLTATDSTSTNPPTPNDMTSTTASPSPPVPQSSALVGIDHASSPSSLIDKEQEEEASTATAGGIVEPVTAESVVSPSSVEATKSMALGEPNHGTGDETEDETANECDDEVGHVIKGDSDCKVNKRRSRDSATTDASSSEQCHEELSNDEPAPVSADTCAEKGAISSESDHRPQVTGTEGKSPTSERTTPANDFYTFKSESDPMSGDVAEMARMRAAKFIQERTKMACVLNSTAETEHLKQAANAPHLANSGNQGGGGGGGGSGSRKRKLTVKDILVSQRNRESGGKQQRVHESSSHSNSNNATSNNFPLNHMFPGLGSMMEPSLHGNEGNPFAAISAALAAAAATNNGVNNAPPSGHLQLPDSQSAYISTLASSLSSANGNPTATLALMASLSAMMQHSKESNEGAANAASNPLVSLESTLANVMASNFGQHNPQQPHRNCSPNDDDEDVDEEDDHRGEAPVDFSLKTFAPKDVERPNSRRKSRKKVNGESGSSEDTEIPLDLSVAPKRPEESSPSKHENPLAAMFAQVPSMDGANGSNFAAMAAAAAAAAAASFSPNLLTKMASSMNPWSGFGGMQGLNSNNNNNNNKMGNDAAAAFNVLFQQMQNNNNANSSNKGNPTSLSSANPANLFQSFPDLYWNGGKLSSSKVSTASPSFGGLGNSTSLSSRHHHHHQPPPAASQPMRTKSSSGRQNPWQAQWINRSSEQTRDVFTCVWCKESFKSLAEMTDHMKRSPRCGMAGMQQHHSHHHNSQTAPGTPGHQHGTSAGNHQGPGGGGGQSTGKMSSSSSMSSPPVNPLSMALKESASHHGNSSGGNSSMERGGKSASGVTMPRKLVRGQDVWLGRGAEQTRQILKCMWCGQSFKSLADMTHHMKITQHYTNIISQEQITSWRTPDEKIAQAQVSAVLTCKVCDEAFGTLKELSNHMVKNAHFKEGGNTRDSSGRSTPTSVSAAVASSASGSRNGSTTGAGPRPTATTAGSTTPGSSDRRKKSLPVRKLLELERGEFSKRSPDDDETDESPKSPKSIASQLIECDDCHEKIEPRCFLTHIKQCRARNAAKSDAESEKSKADSEKTPGDEAGGASQQSNFDSKKGESKNGQGKESEPEEGKPESNGKSAASGEETGSGSSGSVLSALEKLIEKNFDNKSRRTQQTGILQRLGIDEEVFPPWQNMAPSPLSAMSPTMAAWSASLNGLEAFSRSNSSSSNASNRVNNSCPSGGQAIPQLRYRRNSSSTSLKDKFLSGLGGPMKVATESNGSFSSQETEEEESCDESVNSDCGSSARRSQKRPLYSSRAQEKAARGLNFPISSMLSSPLPVRPTSASSTASSISPSSEPPITPTTEQLHRMTPSSHRSGQDEEEEDHEMGSPLALCKRPHLETDRKRKLNGASEEADDGADKSSERPHSHNPLLQLQKLLDKTNTTGRHSSGKGGSNSNQRMSPFAGWTDSASMKAPSPASSPRTPPIHSPSSASAKSDEASYLMLKCAFCDTQIASRASYRAHLAKVHLAMRDSVDLSPVSDEELLLLVLAKNSSLSLMPGGNSGLLAAAAASAKVSPRAKESASKRKSKAAAAERASWDKSPNHPTSSPSASPALETSQSKFLKYAELAKQLSSKYA